MSANKRAKIEAASPSPPTAVSATPAATPKKKATKQVDGESPSPQRTAFKWDTTEDAIFAELAEAILKAHMWAAVKQDGRLAHRKANGIYMRIGVMIKKMMK